MKKKVSKQPRFKEGDKVIVSKPRNTNEDPGWYSSMDKYDGKEITIESETQYGNFTLVGGDGYRFNPKWLKSVTPKKKARKNKTVADIAGSAKPVPEHLKNMSWDEIRDIAHEDYVRENYPAELDLKLSWLNDVDKPVKKVKKNGAGVTHVTIHSVTEVVDERTPWSCFIAVVVAGMLVGGSLVAMFL